MRAIRVCASEAEKSVWPYNKSVQPRMLKLQANLSPNWSYDKILIDQVRSGWMRKSLACVYGTRTLLHSVRMP